MTLVVCAEPNRRPTDDTQRPTFDSFSPDAFFDPMFGPQTAENDEALANISISPREEHEIGDAAAHAYRQSFLRRRIKVLTRGKDVAYLRDLVATLRPFMKNASRYRNINVHLIDSDETDARSFPGGTLFFTRGLLDFAENEAALVGVVGHELSHLDRGHQLIYAKRIKLAQKTFSTSGAAPSPERFLQTGRILAETWLRPFRPEDESQADRDGATWAFRAGYDPRQFAELLLKMHRRDGAAGAGLPAFLRSHPFHIDRYQAIIAAAGKLEELNPEQRLYIGRKNLNDRIARMRREFDE